MDHWGTIDLIISIIPIIHYSASKLFQLQKTKNHSSGNNPKHSPADLHHFAQPRSRRGLRTSFLQTGHKSTGSSFQNSIEFLQCGQRTSKISSKVQRCMSCPGHFSGMLHFSFDYCYSYIIRILVRITEIPSITL